MSDGNRIFAIEAKKLHLILIRESITQYSCEFIANTVGHGH